MVSGDEHAKASLTQPCHPYDLEHVGARRRADRKGPYRVPDPAIRGTWAPTGAADYSP
jgi:hypothetical protein